MSKMNWIAEVERLNKKQEEFNKSTETTRKFMIDDMLEELGLLRGMPYEVALATLLSRKQ